MPLGPDLQRPPSAASVYLRLYCQLQQCEGTEQVACGQRSRRTRIRRADPRVSIPRQHGSARRAAILATSCAILSLYLAIPTAEDVLRNSSNQAAAAASCSAVQPTHHAVQRHHTRIVPRDAGKVLVASSPLAKKFVFTLWVGLRAGAPQPAYPPDSVHADGMDA